MVGQWEDIVPRAAALVCRRGYTATTIKQILKALKMGRGNLYRQIKCKDALGIALIVEAGRSVGEADLDDLFAPIKPPLRRIVDYVSAVREACHVTGAGDMLATLASELGATPPFEEPVRTSLSGLVRHMERAIGDFAAESGAKLDARVLASAVVGSVHGVCIQWKVDRDENALDAALETVTEFVIGAVARAPRADRDAAADRVRVLRR